MELVAIAGSVVTLHHKMTHPFAAIPALPCHVEHGI
jgi:hypothetical protein